MKKSLSLMLLLAVLLLAAPALGDSEGVIVQSACNVLQSGEYSLVYCFAQVHNNSDQIICLDFGQFELHDGEHLLSSEEVTAMWPYFLNPGEDGYFFDIVSFAPDENGVYIPNITAIDYNIVYMAIDQAHASYDLSAVSTVERDENDGSMSAVCRITNTTDMDAYNPNISVGLYTEGDQLLYADGVVLSDVGIPAGGTVLVRFDVDDAFVSQWAAYGVEPTQAHVNASFRRDED